jgi:hypothetical protein
MALAVFESLPLHLCHFGGRVVKSNRSRCLFWFVLGLLIPGAAVSAECQIESKHFLFVDYGVNYAWHTPPTYTVALDLSERLVFVEDYGEQFEGCDSDESPAFRSCFKSFVFDFAIPNNYGAIEAWTFNGRLFEKHGVVDLRALGKTEQVDRIVSDSDGKKTVYFFSPENGLRGFVIPGEYREVAQSYLSVDEKGPFPICTDS